jgi:RHS repeat-associated protein
VTSAAYKIGTTTDQTIAFTYDAGTYGKGRRTGASDANHSMGWVYDAVGRVTSKSQTVGTVAKTVGYGYTNGNLTSLTTPSGQVVVYGYNSNGQVTSITVNGTTLLSSVSYEPFGPIKGWTWGNGTAMSRTFDTDGKVTAIASGGSNKTYAFDDAFRITGITDTVTSANSYAYGFDSLDRLTSAVKTGTTRGWTYDANGNRLSETGASPSTYTISSSNNRVSSIAGAVSRTYTYDAAGNTLTYSNITATYNNRGRMKTLKKGSTTANFTYNALGELVKRTGGTPGTVHYVYDEAGHLLGEYNSTGALIQETVWLGDTPVATLRPGTPVGVFYVHTDHLNTPRKITRPSDNAARWTWESDPFGSALPNENPASLGTFKYNLRFPGQLYDAHTGLNYNYFRDYDAATGRYIQSDPIGLAGGINGYGYVDGRPISSIDPLGLAAWSVNNSWTEDRVLAYSEYMRTFVETYNRRIDCADLGLLGLIRFAANNGLPVNLRYWSQGAWGSYDASSDAFSSVAQFESLVLQNMGALNVIDNTTAIAPRELRAGDLLMTKYNNTLGHTRIVTETRCSGECENPFVVWYQGNLPPVVPERRTDFLNGLNPGVLPPSQVPRRWNFDSFNR